MSLELVRCCYPAVPLAVPLLPIAVAVPAVASPAHSLPILPTTALTGHDRGPGGGLNPARGNPGSQTIQAAAVSTGESRFAISTDVAALLASMTRAGARQRPTAAGCRRNDAGPHRRPRSRLAPFPAIGPRSGRSGDAGRSTARLRDQAPDPVGEQVVGRGLRIGNADHGIVPLVPVVRSRLAISIMGHGSSEEIILESPSLGQKTVLPAHQDRWARQHRHPSVFVPSPCGGHICC